MNETRWLICSVCSSPAIEVPASMTAEELEALRFPAEHCECECECAGRIELRDDDEHVWAVFVPSESSGV